MVRLMKDSGIEWCGMIPESWNVMPNKYVMFKKKEICSEYNGENILSLTMDGVIIRDLEAGGKMPATFDGYQMVYPNNLLMCLFDYDVTPRCIGLIKNEGLTSPAYSQFVMKNRNSASYYYYYYLMIDNTKELLHLAKNLRHSFTEEQLGTINTPVPPIEEQEKIAMFLDSKIPEINAIITKTKESIETYKEYKKSVITDAITKGLDDTVPMKDSGIEWIGNIPENWKVGKIKFCVLKVGSGKTPKGGSEVYSIEGVLFIRSQNIYDTGLVLEEPTYITDEIDEDMKNTRVFHKDVLLNITGGSIGRCCIFDEKYGRANVNQHVSIIRVNESMVLPKFMHYYWLSKLGNMSINLYQTGGNREGMSADAIKNSPFIYNSLKEQEEIVNYLDEKCAEIDALIAKKEAFVEEMETYKKSLIYEYVTGKKEVV